MSFAEHLRNLLVSQDHKTIELLTVGDQIIEKYKAQTLRVSAPFLIKSLNLVSRADIAYRTAQNQRLLVELTLINVASLSTANTPAITTEDTDTSETEAVDSKKKIDEPIAEKKTSVIESQTTENAIKNPENPNPVEKENIESPVQNDLKEKEIPSKEISQEQVKNVDRTEEIEALVSKKQTPVKSPSNVKTKVGIVSESISISDYTKEIKIEESDGEKGEALFKSRSEEVVETKFQEAWLGMIKNYEEKGKISLFSTLSKYKPTLSEGLEVEVTYGQYSSASKNQ